MGQKITTMSNTGKIISGIALLLFGIGWALELTDVINFSYEGWWTLFIIIPCLIGFFSFKDKGMSLIGIGTGVLLLLATRGVIEWSDFWKYLLCLIAVIWGFILIFCRKNLPGSFSPDKKTVKELRQINQDGRSIRQINIKFGKQLFEFAGQRFEGATVQTSFGFVGIDLRNADILDGAVIDIDCNFGGMEIRVGDDVIVKPAVEASFAGVECNDHLFSSENAKIIYVKGKCIFGGIEIK